MPRPSNSRKTRATLYVSEDLLEEARDAAVFLANTTHRHSLTTIVDDALAAELFRLRAKYFKGLPFPRRDADLKGGRPLAA
jgi:post-segregation antitoxin (ccd killing protein)